MSYLAPTERSLRLDVLLSSLRLLEKETATAVTDPLARERLLSQIRLLISSLQEQRAAFPD